MSPHALAETVSRRSLLVFGAALLLIACESDPPSVASATPRTEIVDEGIGTTPIGITWDEAPSDAWTNRALQAAVHNRTQAQVQVGVSLLALGLDQRVSEIYLTDIVVDAESSQSLDVPIDAIPIQSISTAAQVILVARYAGDRGDERRMYSDSLHVRYRDDYSAVVIADPDDLPYLTASSVSDPESIQAIMRRLADVAPTGRYWQDKRWNSPGPQDAVLYGPSTTLRADPGVLQRVAGDVALVEGGNDLTVEKGSRASTVCFRWRALYVDSDQGEDLLKREEWVYGTTSYPAMFATLVLQDTTTFTTLFSGQLNALGCTPSVSLVDGHSFQVIAVPDMIGSYGANRTVTVLETPGSNGYRWYAATFKTTTTSATMIKLHSSLDELTNTAAVAARVHDANLGLPAGTYTLYARQQGVDAYYGGPGVGAVHLGYDALDQQSLTRWKFIVAHELGHMAADKLQGLQAGGLDAPEQRPYCGCEHITNTEIRGHCIQSTEYYGVALDEGYAHFIAAAFFNVRAQSDCAFLYYKQFKNPNTSPSCTICDPPIAFDCAKPVAWWSAQCGRPAGLTVELDWLTFFWDLYSRSPALTLAEIADVIKRACNSTSGLCPSSDMVLDWTRLKNAASAKWGAGTTKYNHFISAGAASGVDHN